MFQPPEEFSAVERGVALTDGFAIPFVGAEVSALALFFVFGSAFSSLVCEKTNTERIRSPGNIQLRFRMVLSLGGQDLAWSGQIVGTMGTYTRSPGRGQDSCN